MEQKIKKLLQNNATRAMFLCLAVSVVMSFVADGFMSAKNISNILKTTSMYTAVALAQLVLLSIGQFSLALAPMGILSAMVCAVLTQVYNCPPIIAAAACIATGTLLGFIHGTVTARTGLNPFIVTLAFQSIFQGLAIALLQGKQLAYMPQAIMNINKLGLLNVNGSPLLPYIFILAAVCLVLVYLLYRKTSLGHKLLLVGDSKRAAEIAGIKPKNIITAAYTINGFLVGVAGLMGAARFGGAPLTMGTDWVLFAFAGSVLGGTLLTGGKVNVIGAFFGSLMLQLTNYSLQFLRTPAYWTQTILGCILVLIFSMDYIQGRLALRASMKASEKEFKLAAEKKGGSV